MSLVGWNLEIKEMSWVENTEKEVDFIIESINLKGNARILDLACGFGRHSLELSRRGYSVVGVDYTKEYIDDAVSTTEKEKLNVSFIQADVLTLTYSEEFDVVLNMADGAIGYFDTEEENLKLFDVISKALKKGGKHVMAICSADHAKKHCPKRGWQAGKKGLSIADFTWNDETSRLFYNGNYFRFGKILEPFNDQLERAEGDEGLRLYTVEELKSIFATRNMRIINAYGDYDTTKPASEDMFMLVVCSEKE